MRQGYWFQNTLFSLKIPLTKEFHFVMICAYTVTTVPKYAPSLRFHTFFSIGVVQYAVLQELGIQECLRNMRQNFGIRSYIPKEQYILCEHVSGNSSIP